jgi:hypothetical protein
LSANAVDPSGPTPENVGRIDILIEGWATPAEQEKLHAAVAGGAICSTLKTSTRGPRCCSARRSGHGLHARERRRHAIWFA